MRYTIEARRGEDVRIQDTDCEASAMDAIDNLVASGFAIVTVTDQDGKVTPSIEVLQRLLAAGEGPGAPVDAKPDA